MFHFMYALYALVAVAGVVFAVASWNKGRLAALAGGLGLVLAAVLLCIQEVRLAVITETAERIVAAVDEARGMANQFAARIDAAEERFESALDEVENLKSRARDFERRVNGFQRTIESAVSRLRIFGVVVPPEEPPPDEETDSEE